MLGTNVAVEVAEAALILCCTADLAIDLPNGTAAPVKVTKTTLRTKLACAPFENEVAVPRASPLEAATLGAAVYTKPASPDALLVEHPDGRPWEQPLPGLELLIPSR